MLFVDLNQKKEIDIDEITGVSLIKSCMGDEENFYILANKKDKILFWKRFGGQIRGYYL